MQKNGRGVSSAHTTHKHVGDYSSWICDRKKSNVTNKTYVLSICYSRGVINVVIETSNNVDGDGNKLK